MSNITRLIAFTAFLGFITLFTNCQKDKIDENLKNPPALLEVKAINSTTTEIEFDGLEKDDVVNVLATDQYGETLTFSDFTESPIRVNNLTLGNLYTFQLQTEHTDAAGNTVLSEFGAASTAILASTIEDSEFSRVSMLQNLNNFRTVEQTCGTEIFPAVEPLAWNDKLENAAEIHSLDMHQHDFFNHVSESNNQNTSDRLNTAGYNFTTWSENIAQGYPDGESVHKAWAESPIHCKNIMNGRLTEVGVSKEGKYWTQVFGSR